jgi:mRNA-degrading endonuclease RelE of RelBE toxin-antitoxin system
MAFKVIVSDKALKSLSKLPRAVKRKFDTLHAVLIQSGASGPHYWHNYSKLGENEYHCHLSFHYAACWRYEKNTITIEVYYVGSRENAPY